VVIMSGNAINKAGGPWSYSACIHGNVNHLWHCYKIEDLIMCGGLCETRVSQVTCVNDLLKS
jgi:hypothetical protein